MLGLAGVLVLVAGAAEVSLTVATPPPCLSLQQLARKLRSSGLEVVERPGPQTLTVTLRGQAKQLTLSAQRGSLSFSRTIPAESNDCAAVERVALALINAWAHSAPAPTPDAGTPLRVEKETPRPPPVVEREADPPSTAELPARATLDAPVPELDASIPEPTIDAGVVVIVPVAIAIAVDAGSPRPAEGPSLRLEAAVLGGVSVGATPQTTAAGALFVAFSSRRWGALLDVGLESERAHRQDAIRVSAIMQWLGISLRVNFQPLDALTLDVALGARGWRTSARATGVDDAREPHALTAGPALSAGASWRVYGPLHVHLRPSAALRVEQLSLSVDGVGRVLLLDLWTVGITLGALVRFE